MKVQLNSLALALDEGLYVRVCVCVVVCKCRSGQRAAKAERRP